MARYSTGGTDRQNFRIECNRSTGGHELFLDILKELHVAEAPVKLIDWQEIFPFEHSGESGSACERQASFGDSRMRLVEYSPGYIADHWCARAQTIFLVAGDLTIRLFDGSAYRLDRGMACHVGELLPPPHIASTEAGATMFIVD